MSFKNIVAADIDGVFLNTSEFSELRSVIYDDITYTDIPVILEKIMQKDRPLLTGNANHLQGLHIAQTRAYIGQGWIDFVIPEKGRYISISDGYAADEPFYQRYRIVTSDTQMGMVVLELEAYDE